MLSLGLRLFVSLLAATLLGCGSESTSEVKSIINSLDISLLTKEQNDQSKYYAAVGNLMVSMTDPVNSEMSFTIPYCTAVSMGNGYFLTAGHCEKESAIIDQNQIAKEVESGKIEVHTFDEQLRLYYSGEMIEEASQSSGRKNVKFVYQSENYDFAIIHNEEWQQDATIDIFKSIPTMQESSMELVGHPHGLPKSKTDNCHLKQVDDEGYIYHDCDSVSGVSGGLLLADGMPVGIHIQATAPNSGSYYRENNSFESSDQLAEYYQCDTECPDFLGFNVGFSFESIKKDLQANALDLIKKIKGKSKCRD